MERLTVRDNGGAQLQQRQRRRRDAPGPNQLLAEHVGHERPRVEEKYPQRRLQGAVERAAPAGGAAWKRRATLHAATRAGARGQPSRGTSHASGARQGHVIGGRGAESSPANSALAFWALTCIDGHVAWTSAAHRRRRRFPQQARQPEAAMGIGSSRLPGRRTRPTREWLAPVARTALSRWSIAPSSGRLQFASGRPSLNCTGAAAAGRDQASHHGPRPAQHDELLWKR